MQCDDDKGSRSCETMMPLGSFFNQQQRATHGNDFQPSGAATVADERGSSSSRHKRDQQLLGRGSDHTLSQRRRRRHTNRGGSANQSSERKKERRLLQRGQSADAPGIPAHQHRRCSSDPQLNSNLFSTESMLDFWHSTLNSQGTYNAIQDALDLDSLYSPGRQNGTRAEKPKETEELLWSKLLRADEGPPVKPKEVSNSNFRCDEAVENEPPQRSKDRHSNRSILRQVSNTSKAQPHEPTTKRQSSRNGTPRGADESTKEATRLGSGIRSSRNNETSRKKQSKKDDPLGHWSHHTHTGATHTTEPLSGLDSSLGDNIPSKSSHHPGRLCKSRATRSCRDLSGRKSRPAAASRTAPSSPNEVSPAAKPKPLVRKSKSESESESPRRTKQKPAVRAESRSNFVFDMDDGHPRKSRTSNNHRSSNAKRGSRSCSRGRARTSPNRSRSEARMEDSATNDGRLTYEFDLDDMNAASRHSAGGRGNHISRKDSSTTRKSGLSRKGSSSSRQSIGRDSGRKLFSRKETSGSSLSPKSQTANGSRSRRFATQGQGTANSKPAESQSTVGQSKKDVSANFRRPCRRDRKSSKQTVGGEKTVGRFESRLAAITKASSKRDLLDSLVGKVLLCVEPNPSDDGCYLFRISSDDSMLEQEA